MQEMHLGQSGVMYSVCQSFTKNKEKKKNDGLDTTTTAARSYV